MRDLIRWPLKIAIIRSPLTQARIAHEMGRSEPWLSRAVNGLFEIGPEDRAKLAKLLKKSEAELFPEDETVAA